MSRFFSCAARTGAYLITLLLAAVWIVGALDTLLHPLYDLGRHRVGDVIIRLTGALGLSPHVTFEFAHLLAGLKLMVGALLLTALMGAICEKVRWGTCDDAILDVALFTAGVASVFAALPGLIHGGEPLQEVIGEQGVVSVNLTTLMAQLNSAKTHLRNQAPDITAAVASGSL